MPFLFFMVFVGLIGSNASFADDTSDIQKLLEKADRALQGPAANPTPTQEPRSDEPPTKRRPRKSKSAGAEAPKPDIVEPVVTQPAVPAPSASPLDRRALSEILLADDRDRERGLGASLADSVVRVGAGMALLESGFLLAKDDDTFTLNPSSLFGVSFEFTPPLLSFPVVNFGPWRSRFHVGLSAGAYFGSARAERRGVMQGVADYTYYFFPAGGEAILSLEYAGRAGLEFSYGYGFEALSQRGLGNSDTVSGIFQGDTAKVRLRAIFNRSLEAFALWQLRGRGPISSATGAHSQLFVLGIGIAG